VPRIRTYVRRHHLALLALFVALGGTSYAATNLPANSVGSRQLKSSSVNSSKVRDRSLLANDFQRGQLPRGLKGDKGDRAQIVGTDVTTTIHDDAGAVRPHSCTTSSLTVPGARVGDLPLLAFVGNTPAPPGLTFQAIKASSPNEVTLRYCDPTDVASPVFSGVGVRILTFR
jgi:hypothetical protein